jgi:hypothetical protein
MSLLPLKAIVEQGINLKLNHKSKFYNITIPFRPISDYERSIAISNALNTLTKEFPKDSIEKLKDIISGVKKSNNLNSESSLLLTRYFLEYKAEVVFLAIRDFCQPDLTIDVVKKMRGLDELFEDIQKYSDKSVDELKSFR